MAGDRGRAGDVHRRRMRGDVGLQRGVGRTRLLVAVEQVDGAAGVRVPHRSDEHLADPAAPLEVAQGVLQAGAAVGLGQPHFPAEVVVERGLDGVEDAAAGRDVVRVQRDHVEQAAGRRHAAAAVPLQMQQVRDAVGQVVVGTDDLHRRIGGERRLAPRLDHLGDELTEPVLAVALGPLRPEVPLGRFVPEAPVLHAIAVALHRGVDEPLPVGALSLARRRIERRVRVRRARGPAARLGLIELIVAGEALQPVVGRLAAVRPGRRAHDAHVDVQALIDGRVDVVVRRRPVPVRGIRIAGRLHHFPTEPVADPADARLADAPVRVLADTQRGGRLLDRQVDHPVFVVHAVRIVVGGAIALRRAFRDRRGEMGVLEAGDGQTSGESDDDEHTAHESVIGCWRRRERARRSAQCLADPAGTSRLPNRRCDAAAAATAPACPIPISITRRPPGRSSGAASASEPAHHVQAVGSGIERRRRLVTGDVGRDVGTPIGHVRRIRHHDVDRPARRERGEQVPRDERDAIADAVPARVAAGDGERGPRSIDGDDGGIGPGGRDGDRDAAAAGADVDGASARARAPPGPRAPPRRRAPSPGAGSARRG